MDRPTTSNPKRRASGSTLTSPQASSVTRMASASPGGNPPAAAVAPLCAEEMAEVLWSADAGAVPAQMLARPHTSNPRYAELSLRDTPRRGDSHAGAAALAQHSQPQPPPHHHQRGVTPHSSSTPSDRGARDDQAGGATSAAAATAAANGSFSQQVVLWAADTGTVDPALLARPVTANPHQHRLFDSAGNEPSAAAGGAWAGRASQILWASNDVEDWRMLARPHASNPRMQRAQQQPAPLPGEEVDDENGATADGDNSAVGGVTGVAAAPGAEALDFGAAASGGGVSPAQPPRLTSPPKRSQVWRREDDDAASGGSPPHAAYAPPPPLTAAALMQPMAALASAPSSPQQWQRIAALEATVAAQQRRMAALEAELAQLRLVVQQALRPSGNTSRSNAAAATCSGGSNGPAPTDAVAPVPPPSNESPVRRHDADASVMTLAGQTPVAPQVAAAAEQRCAPEELPTPQSAPRERTGADGAASETIVRSAVLVDDDDGFVRDDTGAVESRLEGSALAPHQPTAPAAAPPPSPPAVPAARPVSAAPSRHAAQLRAAVGGLRPQSAPLRSYGRGAAATTAFSDEATAQRLLDDGAMRAEYRRLLRPGASLVRRADVRDMYAAKARDLGLLLSTREIERRLTASSSGLGSGEFLTLDEFAVHYLHIAQW